MAAFFITFFEYAAKFVFFVLVITAAVISGKKFRDSRDAKKAEKSGEA